MPKLTPEELAALKAGSPVQEPEAAADDADVPWDQKLFGQSNPLTQYAQGFGEKVLGGYLPDLGIGEPENWIEKLSRATGQGVGTAADLIGLSKIPGLGPATVKGTSALAKAAGASGAASKLLGVHGLAKDTEDGGLDPAERLKQGAIGFGSGLVLGPLSQVPGANRVAPRLAAESALFTGMGLASGQELDDALATGIGTAIGMRAAGFSGNGKPKSKELAPRGLGSKPVSDTTAGAGLTAAKAEIVDPVERPVAPAKGSVQEHIVSLSKAAKVPDAESRTGSIFKTYNTGGTLEQLAENINILPNEGKGTPEQMEVIDKHIRDLNRAKKLAGKQPINTLERSKMRRMMELEASLPKEFTDAVKNPEESGVDIADRKGGQFTDIRRQLQGFGGGGLPGDNVFDRFVLRPNEEIQLSVDKIFNDVMERKPDNTHLKKQDRLLAGDIKAAMSDIAFGIQELEKLDLMEEGQDAEQTQLINDEINLAVAELAELRLSASPGADKYTEDLADVFEELYHIKNAGRGRDDLGDVGHRLDHYPAISKQQGKISLKEMFSKDALIRVAKERHEQATKERVLVDRTSGNYFDPRTARRTSVRHENRETDPDIVFEKYAKDMARGIAHQQAVNHNRAYSEYIEMVNPEYAGAAKIIDNYTANAYLDRPVGIDLGLQELANSSPVGRGLVSAIEQNGQAFRRATFALNTGWVLGTQWTSVMPMAGKYVDVMPQASKLYIDPSWRKFVDENLYAAEMKNKRMGQASQQGTDRGILEGLGARTKPERVEDTVGALSRAMEMETVYLTASTMYYRGRQLGLDGKELVQFMSDGVAKYQSMYDRYNRPSVLNSKAIGGWAPMQGYSMDFMNSQREMLGSSRTGAHKEFGGDRAGGGKFKTFTKERMKRLAGVVVGGIVSNIITDKTSNKENFTWTTPIPFGSTLIPGKFGGNNLLYDTIENILKVPGMIERGQYERALAVPARQWAPGGAQIKSTLETIGSVRDAHTFKIEDDEVLQSLIFGGIYSTGTAEEYFDSDKRDKKKSSGTSGMN